MRKRDYQILSRIIRENIAIGRAGFAVEHQSADSREVFRATQVTAETIARRFAQCASVDAIAFLKACGLDP